MFLRILFLLYVFYIVNGMYLENWRIKKDKFVPSSPLLDGPMRLRVYSNCQIVMPFKIGTPPQQFNMSLTLMHPDTILYLNPVKYVPNSKSDPQGYQRKIFNPKESSTFLNYSEEFVNPDFGEVYFAVDNMDYQSIVGVENQPQMDFMMVMKTANVTETLLKNVPADGILSLMPTDEVPMPLFSSWGWGINTFVIWLLKKQGTNSINMTFYLENFNIYDPDEMAQNSFAMVDFSGGSISEYCNEQEWFYADPPIFKQQPFYSMMADKVILELIKGTTLTDIGQDEILGIFPAENFFSVMPQKGMNILAVIVNATFDRARGIYRLKCIAKKYAPIIKFRLVNANKGEMSIELSPNDYILPSKFGDCMLTFVGGKDQIYLLGYSFFRRHCFQLKYDGKVGQVGLALKKF